MNRLKENPDLWRLPKQGIIESGEYWLSDEGGRSVSTTTITRLRNPVKSPPPFLDFEDIHALTSYTNLREMSSAESTSFVQE
jgi:hypothetical protein